MENKTKIIICFSFIGIILSACMSKKHGQCLNDPSLYLAINRDSLLFYDSSYKIYLKIPNKQSEYFNDSKCRKYPFAFINEVDSLNIVVTSLENMVDKNSFKKLNTLDNIYIDNNYIYIYQDTIATYPPLKTILRKK